MKGLINSPDALKEYLSSILCTAFKDKYNESKKTVGTFLEQMKECENEEALKKFTELWDKHKDQFIFEDQVKELTTALEEKRDEIKKNNLNLWLGIISLVVMGWYYFF